MHLVPAGRSIWTESRCSGCPKGLTILLSRGLVIRQVPTFRLLVLLAIGLRFIAAAVTPLGVNFVQILLGASAGDPATTSGIIGRIDVLLIVAWKALPLGHPEPAEAFTSPTFPWSFDLLALVLLAKLPLISLDLFTGLLIYKVARGLGKPMGGAESAALLWLLNPYVFFAIEMWGSPEILAISLTLMAVWLATQGRKTASSVLFAAAIASKLFPLMLLVGPIKDSLEKRNLRRTGVELVLAIVGVAVYVVWSTQASTGVIVGLTKYNPQTFIPDEFTVSAPTISVGVGTVALALTWLAVIELWDWKTSSIISASLAATLSFLAFYNWHPAALLWPLAFLVLTDDHEGFRRTGFLLLLSGAFFAILSNHDAIFATRAVLFVPVAEEASFGAVQSLREFSAGEITQSVILPALRALFAALATMLAASIHIRNGVTLSRIASKMQIDHKIDLCLDANDKLFKFVDKLWVSIVDRLSV